MADKKRQGKNRRIHFPESQKWGSGFLLRKIRQTVAWDIDRSWSKRKRYKETEKRNFVMQEIKVFYNIKKIFLWESL